MHPETVVPFAIEGNSQFQLGGLLYIEKERERERTYTPGWLALISIYSLFGVGKLKKYTALIVAISLVSAPLRSPHGAVFGFFAVSFHGVTARF